ncbi:SRPBCC domain-containing protein [Shimazuella alba]|uniref:SRPBCC domain-containing protein n=1 Tax=Shimazuella alba TaxID=2690964 RepID=UPI00192754A9|nr:SRPBCC domain-containing protein [Shimazuella alba]
MNILDIKYEIYIEGTLEKVWNALVHPKYVKQIYMESVLESTFQEGDPYAYVGPGLEGERTTHVYGTVISCKVNRELSISHYTGKAYNPETSIYPSYITYQLEKIGKTVKLTLLHDRWEENDPSYEGSKKAWPMILSNTKTLIETGRTLDFE